MIPFKGWFVSFAPLLKWLSKPHRCVSLLPFLYFAFFKILHFEIILALLNLNSAVTSSFNSSGELLHGKSWEFNLFWWHLGWCFCWRCWHSFMTKHESVLHLSLIQCLTIFYSYCHPDLAWHMFCLHIWLFFFCDFWVPIISFHRVHFIFLLR